jgi:hypothetical protein
MMSTDTIAAAGASILLLLLTTQAVLMPSSNSCTTWDHWGKGMYGRATSTYGRRKSKMVRGERRRWWGVEEEREGAREGREEKAREGQAVAKP